MGAATAKLFAAEGATVIGVDIDESNARRNTEEIELRHLSQRKDERRSYELGSEILTIPVIPQ
jgi:NAD(P)-dependent dehydrogenase (short-subunit alcohol dehydrogenase family)